MPDAIVAPSLVVATTDTGHYQELADDIYRFIPVVFGPDDPARCTAPTSASPSMTIAIACGFMYSFDQ